MISEFKNANKNIKLALFSVFFIAIGNGLFFSGLYSVFVKTIGGDYSSFGFLTSFGGIILILSLLPGGYLVDRINRSKILKFGLANNFLGYLLLITSNTMFNLYIAQIFINIGNGFTTPALQSLNADSIKTNSRESTYGLLYLVESLGNAVGPLFAVITLFFIGDNWDLPTLKQVFYVAFFFLVIGILIQINMNEKHSLGKESESITIDSTNNLTKNTWASHWWFVPLSIITLGFIIAIGAGLSVSYFGLFFKNVYNLPPSIVNFIFFLASVVSGIIGYLAPRLARRIGKIESMFAMQAVATIMFFLISLIPPLFLVTIYFLLRGALMNGSTPIKNGIVMDLVPKRMRGKMSSLETLSFSLVFSLSAGIGGVVLDSFNFSVLFLTTSIIYVFATLPLIFLFPYVKRRVDDKEVNIKKLDIY